MKACSRCGFYNRDERDRCLKCNAILDHDWGAAQQKVRLRRFPLHRLTAAVAALSRNVRGMFRFPLPEECPQRRPWLAGFLSLLPGLGQIYNRQYVKALWLAAGSAALLWLVIVTILHPLSYVFIAAFIGWILLSFTDAARTAARINGQEWSMRHSIALFTALIFYLGVFFSISQFFLVGLFIGIVVFCLYGLFWPKGEIDRWKIVVTLVVAFAILGTACFLDKSFNPVIHRWVYWSQNGLAPAMRKGDFIYVDSVSYWFRQPRIGDIVFYNPDTFSIKQGNLEYVVNLNNAIERVVAGPGDVFGRDGDRFYRNGREVPAAFQPLHPEGLPQRLEFEVPDDRYLVLFSQSVSEKAMFGLLGTSTAPPPVGGISPNWGAACLVAPKEIYGRCVFIWHPVSRRQWLTPPEPPAGGD